MFSLFINLSKLVVAIFLGVKEDPEFRVLFIFLLTLLFGGTVFYSGVEGWSIVDSLYFCVMTMATIGYGDFVPTTDLSKIFTMVYALLSIGVFVAVVSKIVAIIVQRKQEKHSKH